jgi:translation initiation factor 1
MKDTPFVTLTKSHLIDAIAEQNGFTKKKSRSQTSIKYDGIIRIQREVKGRKGKTVTTVSAFQLADDELKNLAAQLKRSCGTGGSVKEGVIIIQGDHRDTLVTELKNRGFKAKIAGG